MAKFQNSIGITIPTLQEVSDAGNITTTTVHLDGGILSNSINEQSLFQPSLISTVNTNSGSGAEMSSLGYISMSPDGISSGIFAAEYITGEITLQFPNKPTGTYFIATTDDVNTQGLPTGGTAGQVLTKIDATDYNAQWLDEAPAASYTSTIKHKVKLGTAIAKGQAVYVSSADGTNMIVSKASNTSEATSSKTMGLLETGGATNAQVNVITEGLLAGLNTAGQTAGDPVWLGTNGDLIYGLINKPYAPAHLVFIGIVTRVNSNNGEIFVKCQNGFELKEIHDVDLITTTPINGHLLGFDGTLWVNKTIASWLGFTPVTDARTISTTAPLSGGGDLSANRTLSITQATTSTDGYLSSTNWNTFNNKFTLPSLTSGSVLFSNGSTIAQDNANLFWDDTNNRLGIGTAAPAYGLDVNGTARVSGTNTITPAALTGTAATSALDIAQTWNTTGTPSAIKLNITDTASNASSKLIDLQVGGASRFSILKTGVLNLDTTISGTAFSITNGGTTYLSYALGTGVFSVFSGIFTGAGLSLTSANTTAIGNIISISNSRSATSGIVNILSLTSTLAPTSGTAIFNGINFAPTINQTGVANGITRGLYINPTLTAAADFRAIEVANGITILGASTTVKASLRIPSGTAPTTPTNGDIWFDGTDLKMRIGGVTKTFTLL